MGLEKMRFEGATNIGLHLLAVIGMVSIVSWCTKPEVKAATKAAVQIADALCREETGIEDGTELVQLACQAEQAASPVVHVLLPRKAWAAMRQPDAGPGR
jgi:hypothetical protein